MILVVFSASVAPAILAMFPDLDARNNFAESFNNPIMVAMMGPIYGLSNYTAGAMYSGMMLLWVIIAACVMNIFFVVRHTRADEEHGRTELIRSLPAGRLANVNATMLAALVLNVALGLFMGLCLAVLNVESIGFSGSMIFGAAVCTSGLVFASIAALFSQLSSNSSGASGMSLIMLGVLYMLRAAGDIRGIELVSCISPLGLAQRSQAYVENNVWPSLLLLLEAVVISAIAYKLNSIRDLGQGFIAAKPGHANAPASLLSPFGLAWRLLRGRLITWAVVMFVLGASYGSVVANISSFIGDSPEYMTVIGVPMEMLDQLSSADKEKLIVDSFGQFVTIIMTLVCIVPMLNAAMKARSEEREGRTEHILARAVPRVKYLMGYVALAYIAGVVIQFATAAGLYSATAALTGTANPFNFGEMLKTYFALLPAAWVLIGLAVLLVGLLPKAVGIAWGYFGAVFFVSFIGAMALPDWALNISPLHHIPMPEPFEHFTLSFPPLIILTVIAAVLTAMGVYFYSKRDTA
ncbi:MAG: hypothetical protein FWH33_03475 [Oscillospiraceae bacterium]|nr:hypothetical protein [Oscillospiraceae bacterium]